MPKLTPIHVGVEEEAVGRIMRLLHSMPGVATVYIDYGNDEKKKKPSLNGSGEPRKTAVRSEVTGVEAVANALFGKPPMTTSQLRDVFISQDRSPKSISSVVYTMKEGGDLQGDGTGGWSLTKKARDRMRHRKAAKKK